MKSTRLVALAALLLSAATAFAGARQDAKVYLDPDPALRKLQEDWGFANAITAGEMVYVSGVVAGLRPGETDLAAAYTRAFDHLGAILSAAGASWDDVVDITSYHTDVTSQMPAIVAVKNRYVKPPFPAWTAVQVARLIPPNGITEIKLVARLARAGAK